MNLLTKLLLISLSFVFISCGNNIQTMPSNIEAPANPISECPDSPNCFRTTQFFDTDSTNVFEVIQYALKEMNAFELEVENTNDVHHLDAIFKIPVFGWLDDVKIIVTPNQNNLEQTFVHLKSSSREGYSDLGVNKRRINKILKISRKKLNSQ